MLRPRFTHKATRTRAHAYTVPGGYPQLHKHLVQHGFRRAYLVSLSYPRKEIAPLLQRNFDSVYPRVRARSTPKISCRTYYLREVYAGRLKEEKFNPASVKQGILKRLLEKRIPGSSRREGSTRPPKEESEESLEESYFKESKRRKI